ncbi:hypothetical protein H2198_009901 [Neophaeococcomyces mojaviensis]|uniref:Uncharacterized protein n=1 Tax=Neophaeococcomyces mojaviensis TaxID=3383035 RepID=A0ACC2ZT76_9EURO|nr:hypothetical protein H2198_009901 [Knufia sp. JES_112]
MSTLHTKETWRPAFPDKPLPKISYGLSYPEACKLHVESTLGASKVYLILSKSLAANHNALELLQQALGDRIVGVRIGMKPHTQWSEVLEIIHETRTLKPDCIITVGAGTLTDAAKVISFALANNAQTEEDLDSLSAKGNKKQETINPPTIRQISVPTSLSGGEYSSFAGATNDKTKVKTLFTPPVQNPEIVILDPQLACTTPSQIWLSTGVRAIDHCVETLCSLEGKPEADVVATKALEMLTPALLQCQWDPKDPQARFQAQLGSIEAMRSVTFKVPMGASYSIGHQLGPFGVGHGETSCICLPAVCKYNALKGANVERQQKVAETLLNLPEVQTLMNGRQGDLSVILDVVIRALGMPRSLKDMNIGRDKLDQLAENTLMDHWAKTNPYPLTEKSAVLELLELMVE